MEPRTAFELTDAQEHALTRVLQVVLVGILAFGVARGNLGVAINAGGALAVSALPALLRREFRVNVDFGIALWLTVAVSLHAIGVLGPYRSTAWWDYLTHALSASIVTGIAYAVVTAIDRHSEAVYLPEPYLSFTLVTFAIAMGVVWELLEFGVTKLSSYFGGGSVLVVFGVGDIVTDLLFTAIGGTLVVLWGRGDFRGLAGSIRRALRR